MSVRWHRSPNGYYTATSGSWHKAKFSFRLYLGVNSTFSNKLPVLEVVEKKPNGKVGKVLHRRRFRNSWNARWVVGNLLDMADCDEWFMNALTSMEEPKEAEQPHTEVEGVPRLYSWNY